MSERLDAIAVRESALRQAQLDGDVQALDDLLADDLVGTDQNGQPFTKADDLAMHRARVITLSQVAVLDQVVRDHGDVIITITDTHVAGRYQGEPFDGQMRYTRVWRLRDHRWQIASAQLSPLT